MMYDNISLVIQGPVDFTELKDAYGQPIKQFGPERLDFMPAIEYYKSLFPEIILSTYTEQIDDEIREYCREHGIKLVHQSFEIGELEKKYNITYQALTCLEGAKHCTKKYMLKHRTDERYSNLDKLINLFMEDDEKWVSGSTIFSAASRQKFHAADHLYIAKTKKLITTYEYVMEAIRKKEFDKNPGDEPAPEVTFTKCFIKASGEEPEAMVHDYQMKKWFNFINDRELFPYVIKFNTVGRIYTRLEDREDFWIEFNTMDDILTKGGMFI